MLGKSLCLICLKERGRECTDGPPQNNLYFGLKRQFVLDVGFHTSTTGVLKVIGSALEEIKCGYNECDQSLPNLESFVSEQANWESSSWVPELILGLSHSNIPMRPPLLVYHEMSFMLGQWEPAGGSAQEKFSYFQPGPRLFLSWLQAGETLC